jgi:hypothetical protein
MSKYTKVPITIDAAQWFKNGDHPHDAPEVFHDRPHPSCGEGKVVRYFRHPEISGAATCKHCSKTMYAHGWIDTLEGGHVVCPGDWIITGVKGENYPCKPDIFALTYVKADECTKGGV